MSHPVQYMAPLFRHVVDECPEIALTVVYVTLPTPSQQGASFGIAFAWDVPLLSGYDWRVLRGARRSDSYDRFLGIDARGLPDLVLETAPDVAVVLGWHFAGLLRAILAIRRAGIPVLYRGDSNLTQGPPNGWRRRLWEERTRRLLKLFDGYLAVGTRSREYLCHFGVAPESVFNSPHCVDNDFFARNAAPYARPEARGALRRNFGLPTDGLVILFVGKLEQKKRPLDLLRAVARAKGHPTVLMIGSGPLEAACRAEASRLGIAAVWPGFLNQSQLASAYSAADVLALPSGVGETWGLVVNEAMSCGLPCIVSDQVGCATDLVVPGVTGEVYPSGSVDALARAINQMADLLARGQDFAGPCRERADKHSLRAAADGLSAAAKCGRERRDRSQGRGPAKARVVAALEDFTVLGGLERMTFEVLKILRERGTRVHCVLNDWRSLGPEAASAASAAARHVDATWSMGSSFVHISRRSFDGLRATLNTLARMVRSSASLLHELVAVRATHVLLPTHLAAIRNAPALLVARAVGVRSVLRVGTAPARGARQAAIWRFAVDPLIDAYVCNSRFTMTALLSTGATPRKVQVIYNCLSRGRQELPPEAPPAVLESHALRVVYVGQVIPEKGLLVLMNAFARLSKEIANLQLDVLGRITGWEHPLYRGHHDEIRSRANEPDLAGKVRLLGWQEDVSSVMSGAAVHCCPSAMRIQESFANVCIEAKAAGVPSVVTPSGGLPEAVRHGVDGWICRDDGEEAIVEGLRAVLTLSEEDRQRMGMAAADSVNARFGRRRFATAWGQVFSTVRRPASAVLRLMPGWSMPVLAMIPRPARRA